ncbi:hypothetical protein [Thermoflexus hugenholtzii]|jgi:hypothetical protein|uniref:Uncharacterized protein n=1 Tax=Thermoflexus hugenholtzii JAD2 TaxID=877466 RepID=A0A212RDL7_9CHLR|nr:hypothetical protein [Thermoflexus hugenholtzii]SNB70186.1 hypothetical protein SAMN02746019_00011700 [Thermoflexus hugenholtzii JAD2]
MDEIIQALEDLSLAFCVSQLRSWGVRPEPADIRAALRDGRIRDICGTSWMMLADYLERNPDAIERLRARLTRT